MTPLLSHDEIVQLDQTHVVPSYRRAHDATIPALVRGQGLEAWDATGKRYLDFGGGIAVNVLGHAHPAMVQALTDQAQMLIHTSNLYFNQPQAQFAQRLLRHLPDGKMFFCNSGAEANEALYKLARLAGHDAGRYEIITTINSFHGRTMAGIAATGQDKVKKGFEPVMSGFTHVPYNDLAAVAAAITPRTAAVLVEGIQGEGGILPATPEYLLGLRQLCTAHGILLMMDSVQCGHFRTGRFQSYERILEGVEGGADFIPDAISMAKSLGGGFPIGAIWIHRKYCDLFQPGSHGTTYGGTPLGCAVSLAVLETIEKENLMENARAQGDYLLARLRALIDQHPTQLNAVRGYGCMLGLVCVAESATLHARLQQAGLILIPSGTKVLRWLPPLNVTRAECEEALAILENAIH
jgi:acetylornithine/N-succinyldiaminopimelate aminotransferase